MLALGIGAVTTWKNSRSEGRSLGRCPTRRRLASEAHAVGDLVPAGELAHRADGPGPHDDTFALLGDVLGQSEAQSAGCSSGEPSGGGQRPPDRLLGHHRRHARRLAFALTRRDWPRSRHALVGERLWQGKLRYRTQDELLSVAREYRRRGLPLSVIVSDFFHWKYLGDWSFDTDEWPDLVATVTELESIGTKLMVSVSPSLSPLSANYRGCQKPMVVA